MGHHHDRDNDQFDEHGNTRPTGSNYISTDLSDDGVDRRGFLRCMAWAGNGDRLGNDGGRSKVICDESTAVPVRHGAEKHLLRPDQRQPHRLREGSEQGRHGNAARGGRTSSTRCRRVPRSCCTPATSHSSPSPRNSTRRTKSSRASGPIASSTSPASTTSRPTTASHTCSATARARRAVAGTASTTPACTSSASSTS